jgi:tetratricopeptide (TPR) repeat protein
MDEPLASRDSFDPSAHLFDDWALPTGTDHDDDEAAHVQGGGPMDQTCRIDPSPVFASTPSPPLDFGLEAPPIDETRDPGGTESRAKGREFPRPGEMLNRFRILSELGRGAFARVYLAEQVDLADRRVALKVSAIAPEEPQNLSRLQHTHIVPIHSLHIDDDTGWQLICMPYLGGANLAQVLAGAGGRDRASVATGRSLVEALDRVRPDPLLATAERVPSATGGAAASWRRAAAARRGPVARPTVVRSAVGRVLARLPGWDASHRGSVGPHALSGVGPHADADEDDPVGSDEQPARRYLRSATYVQAAMWLVARLAEGLQHAHERGILHRDLKPSNVLIAADGTPMLLDFNLSVEVPGLDGPSAEEGRPTPVGGTLPYMAPEHLEALRPEGRVRPADVGPAADIYALGLILYEIVVGRLPFDDPPEMRRLADTVAWMIEERRRPVASARAANPAVPWGLESILRTCLAPDPDRRYACAGDLAADLRRMLDDRPLRHAPELSLRERAAKWRRRHPRVCGSATVGVIAGLLLVGMGASAAALRGHLEASEARLAFQAFQPVYRDAQLALNTASAADASLAPGIARASDALERYRVGHDPRWVDRPAVASLPPADRRRLLEQLSEIIQLRARAQAHEVQTGSGAARREAVYRSALSWLDLAQAIDPHPGPTLDDDRARYLEALGDAAEARKARQRRDANPPRTVRDLALLGSSLLAEGRAEAAEAVLNRATALDPGHFWAWFTLGLCELEEGRPLDASQAFAAAALIEPTNAWAHLNRALALARAGRIDPARYAADRAVELDPDWPEARLQRARIALEQGDPTASLADLDRALALGRQHDPAVQATRAEALARLGRRDDARQALDRLVADRPDDAEVRLARGVFRLADDRAGAVADLESALRLRPDFPRALLGRAFARRADDPHAALNDLDRALELDPNLADALELRALIRARQAHPEALADVERLLQAPTARRLYNAACATALVAAQHGGDPHLQARAVELLQRARERGFPLASAAHDPDLAGLRGLPEFSNLMAEKP